MLQPIRMQGQQLDAETGLFYNRYRYYDPAGGRYVTQDPIGLLGGANLYGYVYGRPTTAVDPNGLQMIPGGMPTPMNAMENLWNSAATSINQSITSTQKAIQDFLFPSRNDGNPEGYGCGDSKTDRYVPDFFPLSCRKHDLCYAQCDGPSQAMCDVSFFGNMVIESGAVGAPALYYGAVATLGKPAYEKARQSCPAK
jgi:RHS repeat-associated protein